ncbi:hypothetical protein SEA_SATIS_222 [Streptomyces phage Satis]|nr:hypothetical protein SEA_SATIS_222 [Streptomyces phage Satis]QBZ72110.1 hypothetical protein SEA_KRADAL_224 [Streptomyces phage Kradal]QPL14530.1 hypothetical protein SEA_EHYELIMAYOE_225 [Streptomyces phage EhyElimayoE]
MSDETYVIEKGNIYESADPRDDGRQIRVTSFYSGYSNANIVSHPSGKNHRSINVRSLHKDRNTGKGTPRKNGYFFVGKHEESAEPTA